MNAPHTPVTGQPSVPAHFRPFRLSSGMTVGQGDLSLGNHRLSALNQTPG